MRLVTFTVSDSRPRLGALVEHDAVIVDLTGGEQAPPALRSMLALIRAGAEGLALARQYLTRAPRLDRAACRLLSPLPRPEQIRCFSTFEQHVRQSAQAMMKVMAAQARDPQAALEEMRNSGRFEVPPVFYERPLYYKGNRFAVVGTATEIRWPAYSQVVDYELELAAVIGRGGRDIPADQAGAYIFGYTVCNDLSARDEQAREMAAPLGPAKGKDFDGGNVLGPCIVTADEVGDPYCLRMTARVNDIVRCDSNSAGMTHRFEDMIAYASCAETLYPGELLLSGCAGGGCGMELGIYPQKGDTITLEIEKIGSISNRIV